MQKKVFLLREKLLIPDKRTLIHKATDGRSDSCVKKGPVSVDKSISESLERKPVVILDASTDERISNPEETKKEGIASSFSLPMMLRDELIGVIRLYTRNGVALLWKIGTSRERLSTSGPLPWKMPRFTKPWKKVTNHSGGKCWDIPLNGLGETFNLK